MTIAGKIASIFKRSQSNTFSIEDVPPNDLAGLTAYLVAHVARNAKLPPGTVITGTSIVTEMRMDSLAMLRLSKELEDRLGISIEPGLVFEVSTVGDLAEVLHGIRLENQKEQKEDQHV